VAALGREPKHCWQQEGGQVPQEVVLGHCRKPKTDRQRELVVLAAEEGTSAAVEVVPERMDCFVDSTERVLPCQDLPEEVVPAEVVLVPQIRQMDRLRQLVVQEQHQRDRLLQSVVPEERHKD